jgi:transposase
MIVGHARKVYAELIERCDLPTFLNCHIHTFEHFGDVPEDPLRPDEERIYRPSGGEGQV